MTYYVVDKEDLTLTTVRSEDPEFSESLSNNYSRFVVKTKKQDAIDYQRELALKLLPQINKIIDEIASDNKIKR